MEFDKAIALPVAAQIALGSGYLAYLIAYAGLRERHTATDAVFRSAAFGLAATAVLTSLDPESLWVKIGAVAATVILGILWRSVGMAATRTIFRRTDISWTDDIPTAWLSVTATRTDARVSQIAVDMEDGRTLFCEDTRRFKDAPHGPCVFGLSGDVALYVTAELVDGKWTEHERVIDNVEGANLTYVPAAKIKRVELRFWTTATGKGAAAAAVEAKSGAAEAPEG